MVVTPANLEAEESVLGAMLSAPRAVLAALDKGLRPEHFYRPQHGHICEAVFAIDQAGEQADAITVGRWLKEHGYAVDAPLLRSLPSAVTTLAATGHHAQVVIDVAAERRIAKAATQLAEIAAGEGTASEKMAHVEQVIAEATTAQQSDDFSPLTPADVIAQVTQAVETGKPITGLPSGWKAVDRLTNGFLGGQMIVVAARPGVGKSAFGHGLALHAARRGAKVALFSLEMGRDEIVRRLLSVMTRVDGEALRTGTGIDKPTLKKLTEAGEELGKLPIYTVDGSVTVTELRARARRLQRAHGLDLLVVDYLQLVDAGVQTENQNVKVATMSRALKLLAMELGIPVIVLSQLSRGVEMRTNKRPMLADLRDSGAIEQDADVVLFLYRDELYDPESEALGEAEVIVAKQRSGPTGTARLTFVSKRAEFSNLASEADRKAAAGGEGDDIPF